MEPVVTTAAAKMMLRKPERYFQGYPPLATAFFGILDQLLTKTTSPIDFILRFEEAFYEVQSKPDTYGHASIFIATMRLTLPQVADQLFGNEFSRAVETRMQEALERNRTK